MNKIKHVYFINDKRNKLIKIGTSFKPLKRFEYFRTKLNGYELIYVFWGGGLRKEKEFHIKFKKYLYKPHYSREWFIYSKEIKDFISVLKDNNLVWIGQKIDEIPKADKYIGFKTDSKTYNKIKELGEINGRSVHEMTNYIIKLIARNDPLKNEDILYLKNIKKILKYVKF